MASFMGSVFLFFGEGCMREGYLGMENSCGHEQWRNSIYKLK